MKDEEFIAGDLLFALENFFERGRELEEKRERVKDAATPSYWMADEYERYDKAKRIFMDAMDKHIDQRVSVILKTILKEIESGK